MLDFKFILKRIFILCLIVVSAACEIDKDCTTPPDLSEIDESYLDSKVLEIENYLDSLGLDYLSDPSGVRIVTLEEGSGNTPDFCSIVNVTYTGRILGDSAVFNTAVAVNFDLDDQELITGWFFGLANMEAKGEYIMFIPAPLGYGRNTLQDGSGNVIIPEDSNLAFRIRLNNVFE